MKCLSPGEVTSLLNQIDNLIEDKAFDEAISLSRNTLKKYVLPDKVSIKAIMDRIKLARSLKKNPFAKKLKLTNPYDSNTYFLPKYQSCEKNNEEKHLSSLIKYIKQENLKDTQSISESRKQTLISNDNVALDHEEIIQISINKELANKTLEEQKRKQLFISKTKNRPFFARFDFNDNHSRKIIYISDTNTNAFINSYGIVKYVDWRAPIAKPFYDYRRPTKNVSIPVNNSSREEAITGTIDLVAQYSIKKSIINNLEYDSFNKKQSTDNINNNILQEKLESNSHALMEGHADTLQAEQYALTSYNNDEDLIVQGVAGSGKTVIALSRLVFLKYKENKNFSNDNILYISPNADFSQYVSNVSIELGETRIPIKTMNHVIDEVFKTKNSKQSAANWENISTFAEKYNHKKPADIKKKFTKTFQNKFYSLCEKLDNDAIITQEYNSQISKIGELITQKNSQITNKVITLKELKEEQANLEKQSLQLPTTVKRLRSKIAKKIEKGDTDVDSDLEELKKFENDIKITKQEQIIINRKIKGALLDIAKDRQLFEKLKKSREMTLKTFIRKLKCNILTDRKNNSAHSLYAKNILPNSAYIKISSDYSAIITISPKKYLSIICSEKAPKKYAYENLPYYIIIKFLIERANGNNLENNIIKHIVVDEAQDYTEPYFYFLRQAFPNAVFTILGDKNQNINPFSKFTSLENLIPDIRYKEINTAYRSSPEIVNYCNHILNLNNIRSIRKSQGINVVEQKTNSNDLTKTIEMEVSRLKELKFKRIGIITSNQKSAEAIKNKMNLLSYSHKNPPIIISVFKAKGLEYDAAIIINDYKKESKNLFYVACTRAKHALTVIKL